MQIQVNFVESEKGVTPMLVIVLLQMVLVLEVSKGLGIGLTATLNVEGSPSHVPL